MLISKGDHFNDDELVAVRVKRGNEIAYVIILWVSYYVYITDQIFPIQYTVHFIKDRRKKGETRKKNKKYKFRLETESEE